MSVKDFKNGSFVALFFCFSVSWVGFSSSSGSSVSLSSASPSALGVPVDDSSRVAVEDLSFKILSLPAVPSFSLNFWSNTGKNTNYKR